MTKLVIIDRKSGEQGIAVRTEDGKYSVVFGDAEAKVYSESTFKKYFKLTGDTVEDKKAEKKVSQEGLNMKKESMIETVKKLLALAGNNPSQEEATSAALKAQALMAKYHIEATELGEKLNEKSLGEVSATATGKAPQWKVSLAVVIAKNFRCEVYKMGNDEFRFYGYQEDAEVASEVFTSMYTTCYKLTRKLKRASRKESGTARGVGNSFAQGFIAGIRSELDKQCTALMLVTPAEVKEAFQEFSADFKKSKISTGAVTDFTLYNQGLEEGRAAITGRQIEKKA